MKLLFVAPSAYILGGVQDWLYMLTLGLRERGHNVIVAVPNSKYHRLDHFNNHFSGIKAVSFVNKTGTAEGRVRGLSHCILANKADLVIGVNIGDIYEAFWRVKERLGRSKLVMTIHAIEANYFLDIKEYFAIIDAIITTNKLTELMVSNLSLLSSRRIFYAPYGIHKVEAIDTDKRYDCLKIAWVGRIENAQKRVSDLYRVLLELDKLDIDYQLSIAGDGAFQDELKKDLGVWVKNKKVIFYGVLQKREMPLFYSSHNVFLITSQWETGPIVAWEAMACGLAVVSSTYIGSNAEKALMHNETALLYPIGNAKEAALQINRLNNPHFRKQISDNGRYIANSRYSAEASLNAWEEAFISIVNLPIKNGLSMQVKRRTPANSRLELLLGTNLSEMIRHILPASNASSPGSEWPHSLQGKNDQTSILKLAEKVESTSTDNRSSAI
jgi:glycosyltransferase involved in cell wall biosynthesis